MKLRFVAIGFLLVLFISCGKEVIKKNADFVGEWASTSLSHSSCAAVCTISISDKSYFEYFRDNLSCGNKKIKGHATISGSKIHVGLHAFEVLSEPYKMQQPVYVGYMGDSCFWQMRIKFKDEEMTFYKR